MTVRRVVSLLSVCLITSATIVVAAPKKAAPKAGKAAPTAPAKDPAPAAGSGSGSGSGAGSGEPVQMAEDPPPSDMEGTNENPDAPKGTEPELVVVPTAKGITRSGYPIEEVLRPITLPQNMSEVGIAPHLQFSAFAGSDALRARYGITRQIQLGMTYLFGGIFANKDFIAGDPGKTKFHPGKAVGLDVTILLQNWIGVRVGVPIYISPLAFSLSLGAPMKFVFTDKFAIGGFDDLLNIRIKRFPPSFYQEAFNAVGSYNDRTHTTQSRGELRLSAYGIYQYQPKTAIIGRVGLLFEDFGRGDTNSVGTMLRAGFQYTPRKYIDLGLSLGFEDLAHAGTFGPAGSLAIRI